MTTEDITIGTEIANGKCVFLMRFTDRNGHRTAYFISFRNGIYFLYESSTSGVLFLSKSLPGYKSERMQEIIQEIFNRIKPQIKLNHGNNSIND